MIQKMKGFFAECDVCGEELNFDGLHMVYNTKKELTQICQDNGWRRLGRKKWACDKCCKKIDSYTSRSKD